MTKAEELAAEMMAATHTSTATTDDQNKGRKKAARDWVQHYVNVSKFLKELDTKPSSIEELESLLVESWGEKSNQRDEEFLELIGA